MPRTVIVEPFPDGHRFQYVAHLVRYANQVGSESLLLTSDGASESPEFATHLARLPVQVHECFRIRRPDARAIVAQISELRYGPGDVLVVPEADLLITRWWWAFLRSFAFRRDRPRVALLLLGFPIYRRRGDLRDWARIAVKVVLGALTRLARSAHHVFALVGASQAPSGWILERVRDPAICGSHSRDRASLRRQLDLPADRLLVGVFGYLDERKNLPMLSAATALLGRSLAGRSVSVVVAGRLSPSMQTWLDDLDEARRGDLIVRSGHLSDETLDACVAAVDVVAIAQGNNGPSGIMGKAIAAGTPVVNAGSLVRAREVQRLDAGVHVELEVTALADGLRRVLDGAWYGETGGPPLPTAEEFAARLLIDLPPSADRLDGGERCDSSFSSTG